MLRNNFSHCGIYLFFRVPKDRLAHPTDAGFAVQRPSVTVEADLQHFYFSICYTADREVIQ